MMGERLKCKIFMNALVHKSLRYLTIFERLSQLAISAKMQIKVIHFSSSDPQNLFLRVCYPRELCFPFLFNSDQ